MTVVDPFEMIKKVPAGLMLVGRGGPSLNSMKTIFLIQEENKYMKQLPKYNPLVQIRLGDFSTYDARALLFMAKFESNMLYDGWLNYYDYKGRRDKMFRDLSTQEELIFRFYTGDRDVRTIAIPNTIQDRFTQHVEENKKMNPWEMGQFDEIKHSVYAKFPTGNELWQTLSPIG